MTDEQINRQIGAALADLKKGDEAAKDRLLTGVGPAPTARGLLNWRPAVRGNGGVS